MHAIFMHTAAAKFHFQGLRLLGLYAHEQPCLRTSEYGGILSVTLRFIITMYSWNALPRSKTNALWVEHQTVCGYPICL